MSTIADLYETQQEVTTAESPKSFLLRDKAAPLSEAELTALDDHEEVIRNGLQSYIALGEAFAAIQDGKLYRGSHRTFEAYLLDQWGVKKAHGYRLIAASRVAREAREKSPNGDIPKTEAQARELAKAKSSLLAFDRVIQRVEAAGGWGEHTAADIARIVAEELAVEGERAARRVDFDALLMVRGAAKRLHETPLSVLYERRRGFNAEEAERWLLGLRDDASWIAEQADALIDATTPHRGLRKALARIPRRAAS